MKLTPYHNVSIDEVWHVGSAVFTAYSVSQGATRRCCGENGYQVNDYESSVIAEAPYTRQGGLKEWKLLYPYAPHYRASFRDNLARVNGLKVDAWAEMLSGYDVLTELAEGKETMRFLTDVLSKVRHPLQSFKEASVKLAKAKPKTLLKDLGDMWMSYRYAVGPLIYSAQDIVKWQDNRSLYNTARGFLSLPIDREERDLSVTHFFEELEGTSIYRVGAKGRWRTNALQRSERLNFDFATTAWEIIPYSFVVDWFVDVGSYISVQSKTLTSLATQLGGWVSHREEYTLRTKLYLKVDERGSDFYERTLPACGNIPSRYVSNTVTYGSEWASELLLKEEIVDSYRRTLFNDRHLRLQVNPYLNQARLLDSAVLLFNKLR